MTDNQKNATNAMISFIQNNPLITRIIRAIDTNRSLTWLTDKPVRGLVLLMILQVIAWGIMPNFTYPVPHYDFIMHSTLEGNGFFYEAFHHPPLLITLVQLGNWGDIARVELHYLMT